jgi:hypothetical protein
MHNNSQQQQKRNSNRDLARYAGLGAQIFVSLGIAVFAGYKADQWLKFSFPVLVWLLPFLVLAVMIMRMIKETSKRNNANDKK